MDLAAHSLADGLLTQKVDKLTKDLATQQQAIAHMTGSGKVSSDSGTSSSPTTSDTLLLLQTNQDLRDQIRQLERELAAREQMLADTKQCSQQLLLRYTS